MSPDKKRRSKKRPLWLVVWNTLFYCCPVSNKANTSQKSVSIKSSVSSVSSYTNLTSYFAIKLLSKNANSSENLKMNNNCQVDLTPNSTHGSLKDDFSHPVYKLSPESKSELGSVDSFSNRYQSSHKIVPIESDLV